MYVKRLKFMILGVIHTDLYVQFKYIQCNLDFYLAHVIEKRNLRIPNPQYLQLFFNNVRLMYTLCFLVASVKLKVYKKVVKFSFKQQKILGIRNS